MRPSRPTATLALLSFAAYACGETPALLAPRDRAAGRPSAPPNTRAFLCAASRPDADNPGRYRYSWTRLHIPVSEIGADGRTVSYKVRYQDADGNTLGVLNCTLPNSRDAVAYVNRHVARIGTSSPTTTGGTDAPYVSISADLAPVNVTAPAPWNWAPAGNYCDNGYQYCWDSSQGDSGGGGWVEPPPPPPTDPAETCFQDTDPTCNQPLTNADRDVIAALHSHFRDPSAITDPSKRQMCSDIAAKFDQLYTDGKIFRGAYNTVHPNGDGHWGAYDPNSGTFHFDPLGLDQAAAGNAAVQLQMANTALHEAAHLLSPYNQHPAGQAADGSYSDYPFSLLGTGPNQCLTP